MKLAVLAGFACCVLAAGILIVFSGTLSPKLSTTNHPISATSHSSFITLNTSSSIRLQDFSLCSANCVYPAPYLSGYIFFNGSAPLRSFQLWVNGTGEGIQQWHGTNLTSFALWYKGGFENPPVIRGDVYVIKFVAIFDDNSTATAETTLVAT